MFTSKNDIIILNLADSFKVDFDITSFFLIVRLIFYQKNSPNNKEENYDL